MMSDRGAWPRRPAWSGLSKRPPGRRGPNGHFLPEAGFIGVTCGHKHCTLCGRWRPVSDFSVWNVRGGLKLGSRCQTCHNRLNYTRYRSEDESQRALRREYQRFYKEAQRRARGIQPRNAPNRRTVVDRIERVFLPREPILDEIDRWLQVHLPEWRRDEERTVERLGMLAGVDGKTIRRIQTGESQHVQIDIADRLAMALDVPLPLLYPDDDQEVAA